MDKIKNLTGLLERIDAGENPDNIKKESRDLLSIITPTDIVRAEQNISESGLDLKKISRMCRLHVSLVDHPAEKLRTNLPPGHVLRRLLSEHQIVQCLLVDLINLNTEISRLEYLCATTPEYTRLLHIVSHLSAATQHCGIEESMIFPWFEKVGIRTLPQILTAEHSDLKQYIERLYELVYKCCATDFGEFKCSLDKIVQFVVPLKREHIFKEDNLLYPVAFEIIDDTSTWDRFYSTCEQIGYCCF